MNKNIFRSSFIILFLLFFTGCSIKQMKQSKQNKEEIKEKKIDYKRPKVDEKLLVTVDKIIETLKSKDIESINKNYINSQFGFYNLYKIDGKERLFHQRVILNESDFRFDEIANIIKRLPNKSNRLKIKEESLEFKCSPNDDKHYGWTKFGLFLNANTSNKLELLMNKFNNEIGYEFYNKKDLQKAKLIQKESYKVVLTPEVIFYLTKIKKEWFITLFDRLSTNCSVE
ncbi:MAG: hypothetical protein ACQERD_07105 [Campylobacterota bacterium]